jgi:formylglycine-generating enzyme required for sulfatase activity
MTRLTIAALVVAGCGGSADPVLDAVGAELDRGEHTAAARLLDEATVCFDTAAGPMGTDVGEPGEGPEHTVELDAFCIHRYEVTNLQYAAFVEATGAAAPAHWPNGAVPDDALLLPVVGVAWDDANAYCSWARGRLPTEAEWERTCRGPDDYRYPWGNEWDESRVRVSAVAVDHPDDAWPGTLGEPIVGGAVLPPIGSSPSATTPAGVYGMADGAMEWVADWYDADAYTTLPAGNPLATGPTWDHVVRGSAWLFPHDRPEDVPVLARCTARNASHVVASARIGFRCAFDE